MRVPIANVSQSSVMGSAVEGGTSQELVEGLACRRDVSRVAEGRERRLRARLLHLELPLDDLQGPDLHERRLTQGLHGLPDLFHVREEGDDRTADAKRVPRGADCGPR